jgi:hypothetical protein
VLRHRFNWKRLSMAAALAYAHDRSQARIVFQTRPGAYNDESLIEFLQALHDELGATKVTLIWDGLPSQPPHAGLDPCPAPLAHRRTPARLRPRPQPGRGPVGQRQVGGGLVRHLHPPPFS